MRTRDRLHAIGPFDQLTSERARDLAHRYDLTYLIGEQSLPLPVVFTSGRLRIYELR
jgi:hypothetical protein